VVRRWKTVNEPELKELAIKAAEGDIDAAEDLMRGAHDHIFGLLYLLGVPHEDADDLGQDIALQIYTSLPKYDRSKPFLPWMRSIVRHVTSNFWRSSTREEKRMSAFQEYVTEELAPAAAGDILDLRIDTLSRCVERLKEKHRAMVRLRYFENLKTEEISEKVGLTALSVRTILVKVRRALRTCVERAEPRPAGQES
jgi:RNA polymerase sigma-70 factor (ECF subfamily)